jgi:hypothetical protein
LSLEVGRFAVAVELSYGRRVGIDEPPVLLGIDVVGLDCPIELFAEIDDRDEDGIEK